MAKKRGTDSTDTLIGGAGADDLRGFGGKDLLIGNGGNDYLDGGAGDDDLRGGAGNDIYIVDHAGDITKSLADAGNDFVGAWVNYVLGPNQEHLTFLGNAALNGSGNTRANRLTGNDGANVLSGLAGDDELDGHKGIDDLRGGPGNDTYVIDNAREINKTLRDDGPDQVQTFVSYSLGSFQEQLILRGTAALSGTGNAGQNFLVGNDAANVLRGMGGIDELQGGKGNDQLFGDAGNDFLQGGKGNDVLRGGDGDDYLRGDEGIDSVAGGAGDDTYEIDSNLELDKTVVDAGIDRVVANFNYTLGAQQEHLTFYGRGASHVGIGNALNNTLVGSDAAADELRGMAGNDALVGGRGNDRLFGGEGNDFLRGGEGDDRVEGGNGDDIYEIDDVAELNKTTVDNGTDTVGVNFASYVLGAEQENLYFYGTGTSHTGTGNGLNNRMDGTDVAADELFGLAGNDTLLGGKGNDVLMGGDGNDFLRGDEGNDQVEGGNGDDIYEIDDVAELNKITVDNGTDTVGVNFSSYMLGAEQENLYFYGTGTSHTGAGNGLNNRLDGTDVAADVLSGQAGNDRLFGGKGNDVLTGGEGDDYLDGGEGNDVLKGDAGNDTYVIDVEAEINKAELDDGTDTVNVNFNYTLGAQQENLSFYGAATQNLGTGNALNNSLTGTDTAADVLSGLAGNDTLTGRAGDDHLLGGDGNDTLNGGAGDDHLEGGDGNDTYAVDNLGDIHESDFDAGVDKVFSSITYSLLTHQENLTLQTSVTALNGTGNAAANVIEGNTSANILHGGLGDDEINGFGGADSLFGDEGDDLVHYSSSATLIDGGADGALGDTLLLGGTAPDITLDLTTIADTVLSGIENIRFAVPSTHTLKLNAGDVLALSDTSDLLTVFGEADDAVNLTGGGWTKDAGTVGAFQGYTNGAAHVQIDLDILAANVILS